ncbi:hypothetical protein [Chitinophaga sp. XS-30]|uniref:hypothetical protein n=1 Tax=Chitinophaga sp. XS-30 TaxID=2604421 RepID=UPI0011DDFBB2|nr:hypothetical protein [Chitinophaga sp. XS-30]QEH40698.1 hypothetical protein FW415_07345 [Chitinophaga sp. XS-30]
MIRFIITTAIVLIKMSTGFGQKIPEIGQRWDGKVDHGEKIYAPPPLGIQDQISFDIAGILFKGAVKEKKVVFISTSDPDFVINGKKYIGATLSSIRNRNSILTVPGWGRYLSIEDNWNAAFGFESVSDSSRIVFLFKH